MHPLRTWLKKRNISSREFAAQLGITEVWLSNILSFEKPSAKLAREIAAATDNQVTEMQLLYPEDYTKEATDGI